MKFKLGATIPVVQYGNLTPEIEVEADTYEEAIATAMAHIKSIWNDNVENGKKLASGNSIKLDAFVGGSVNYDEVAHVYTNDNGDVYLSGSQYAKKFEKPFDKEAIAAKMANKHGVQAGDIIDIWKLKADTSATFGTAIHKALQLYGHYKTISEQMSKEYHLHDHPVLKSIVESFYEGRSDENAVYEALIVDHDRKYAGQVDRILITGDKKCRVQDFKTNTDITDKLPIYWEQLNFYASILKVGGWEVEGLDIFHYNGKWETHSNKVKEL